jgi:hypothetical protein
MRFFGLTPASCGGVGLIGEEVGDPADGDQRDDPADQERRTVGPRALREQHQRDGDDRTGLIATPTADVRISLTPSSIGL